MKINKTHSILLGIGVVGASTLLGTIQPSQAAPKPTPVKQGTANKVAPVQYRPNAPRAPQQWNNANHGRNDNHGPAQHAPVFNNNGRGRDNHFQAPSVPNRPQGYNGNYRPNGNFGPNGNYRPGQSTQSFQTLTGTVTNDLKGNDFVIRTASGNVRVLMSSGQPSRLGVGDRVQVSGFYRNGTFQAQNLSIVRNR